MSTRGDYPAEGEVIGPYRVLRRIGGGGMGVVFEAHDEALDRRIALKVIAPHLADNDAFRAGFTREAQALASLDSAHVVHVYAHGEQDGRLYIATQLIPDGDLDQLIRVQGPLPAGVALDLMAQVAEGLGEAHAAGLIHRDVKPANVLLRRRKDRLLAYLSDFGIARQAGVAGSQAAGSTGTPAYMAPELHTHGEAGVASDVYALGCLLWASLHGRPPYGGTSEHQVVRAHLEQPVPQLAGTGRRAGEVNRILRAAMAKDPADRYVGAAPMRDDLRRARDLSDTGGWGISAAGRRPIAVPLAGVLLLALLGGGIAHAVGRGSDPVSVEDTTSRPAVEPSGEDLAAATVSLARTLTQRSAMTRAQARCTAERWIDEARPRELQEAGFFDSDWNYVDQDRSAMTSEIEAAARSAALACAGV